MSRVGPGFRPDGVRSNALLRTPRVVRQFLTANCRVVAAAVVLAVAVWVTVML